MSSSPDRTGRVYQAMVTVAIWLAFLSLVALGVQAYQNPDADNAPAPFSCSSALPARPARSER